jgi:DNA primase
VSDDITNEIKSRVLLSTIVGRRTKVVRKGRGDFMALCPFHSEKSPSFHVMDDKGAYYCFGCGEKGDVFSFVQKTENLSFREALEKLAGEAGVQLPAANPEAKAQAEKRQTLHDVLEAACTWYEAQLKTGAGQGARDYFARRGLTAATIKKFRLGFAPAANTHLKDALMARGIKDEMLVEAGLVRRPDDGRATYDYFRDRVTFPIMDPRGRVIAFGARTMGDAEPKYLNSPETALFKKGETLFNLNHARDPAYKAGRVVVCEGYMDVIALDQAGIPEAVAPLGTALTEPQIEALWRVAPEPILCFDGDAAGQRAASRALDRALAILKPGHSLRFLTLPDKLDPDELIRRDGTAAMRALLEGAVPLIEYLWSRELAAADFATPERRAAFEARIGQLARDITDTRVQAYYRDDLRARLRSLMQPARPAWQRQQNRGPGRPGERRPWNDAPLGATQSLRANQMARGQDSGLPQTEGLLMLTLIRHPGLLNHVEHEVMDLHLTSPLLDRLRGELLRILVGGADLDSDAVKGHLDTVGMADTVASLEQDSFLRTVEFARTEAALDLVEESWRHALASHRRQTALKAELNEAKASYEASPTDAGMQRIQAIEDELTRFRVQVTSTWAEGGFSA